MAFQLRAAPSSRVKKASGAGSARKGSPFARHARSKPFITRPIGKQSSQGSNDLAALNQDDTEGPLPDAGPSSYITETAVVSNVIQAVQYVQNTLFTDIPDSRSGMNSTRLAQVLNFRRSLPPVVSIAHVHVLLDAPTKVEREIADLISSGTLRRLLIPGRGGGIAGVGDCLVLVDDWEELVRNSASLEQPLKGMKRNPPALLFGIASHGRSWVSRSNREDADCKIDKFIDVLRSNIKSTAITSDMFTPEESAALVRAGFLVSASSLAKDSSMNPSVPSSDDLTTTEQRAESSPSSKATRGFRDQAMFLSLPNLGPYLRLLSAGRSHMLSILEKSDSGEAPLYLLRDRWDGAVESGSSFSARKRARGESTGVLPGKTKKWKDLYGINFRWALEEALGAGLVEIFDTGSVGPGVRLL